MDGYWVYILCSQRNGTLYIGVTRNLPKRIFEHRQKVTKSFTSKYNVTQLVHAEKFPSIYEAVCREKCLKKWKRAWKLKLIEDNNPEWCDLFETLV